MKISACLIMKNEEKNLRTWIDGVKDVADELIVVDTGSTDGSLKLLNKVAKEYKLTLKTYFFKWVNDFAAAKNFAIDKAKGDFIIFLDADEYFVEEDREKIRPFLERVLKHKEVMFVETDLVNIDKDRDNEIQSKMRHRRIFRNQKDIRYSGKVHERVEYNGKKESLVLYMPWTICHTGYSSSIAVDKRKRNFDILLKEPEKEENYAYLAAGYVAEGNLETALKYIQKALIFSKKTDYMNLIEICVFYIDLIKRMNKSDAEILGTIEECLEATGRHADIIAEKLYYTVGKKDFNRNKAVALANEFFEKAKDEEVKKKYTNSIDRNAPKVAEILKSLTEGADASKDTAEDTAEDNIKISACVIIKNEEKNLRTWVDGVKDVADELIVVDTGSTDGSVKLLNKVAEEYKLNLKIYHFKWINDFAAAKNFAIDKATGDWIIFVDADEYFIEEDRPKIREVLNKVHNDKKILGLNTPRVNVDADDKNKIYSKYSIIRIFRNDENLRYAGNIHEDLRYRGEAAVYLDADLTIYHTGYSKSIIDAKKQRNNELLLKNLSLADENDPESYAYFAYIANAYYDEGNFEEAEKYAKKGVELMKRRENNFFLQAYILYIMTLEKLNKSDEEIESIIDDGLKTLNSHPDLLTYRLLRNLERGKLQGAEDLCREIIEKSKDEKLRLRYMNKIDANLTMVESILKNLTQNAEQLNIDTNKNENVQKVYDKELKISACVIIKNEEKNLRTWIGGVKDVADEIIVVDTGSTDGSIKLLNKVTEEYKLNLKLYHFKWINDFAAAKNFAIDKATGDWIIFLDADEYFIEEDRARIREVLNKVDNEPNTMIIETPLINIDVDNDNKILSESSQSRIFRRMENLKFIGAVHEHLWYTGAKHPDIFKADLTIHRTGYSESIVKAKKTRNRRIIWENKETADKDGAYYYYLSDAYKTENNLKEAEECLKKAVELMTKEDSFFLSRAYVSLIELKREENASPYIIEETIEAGLKATNRHPDVLAEKFLSLIDREDFTFEEVKHLANEINEKAADKSVRQRYFNTTEATLPKIQNVMKALCKAFGKEE